jgi:hypothetical protein
MKFLQVHKKSKKLKNKKSNKRNRMTKRKTCWKKSIIGMQKWLDIWLTQLMAEYFALNSLFLK